MHTSTLKKMKRSIAAGLSLGLLAMMLPLSVARAATTLDLSITDLNIVSFGATTDEVQEPTGDPYEDYIQITTCAQNGPEEYATGLVQVKIDGEVVNETSYALSFYAGKTDGCMAVYAGVIGAYDLVEGETYTFSASFNPEGSLTESSTSNNSRSEDIQLKGPYPDIDLSVEGISVVSFGETTDDVREPTGDPYYDYIQIDTCIINVPSDYAKGLVTVEVEGDVVYNTSYALSFWEDEPNGCKPVWTGVVGAYDMIPGENYDITASFTLEDGAYEGNLDNNSDDATVSLGYPEDVFPDLIVTDTYLDQDGQLNVIIQNQGGGAVTDYYSQQQEQKGITNIYVNDELKYAYEWDAGSNETFYPSGGEIHYTLDEYPYGTKVSVEIDSENAVDESNESNNTFENTLSPDLVVKKIYLIKATDSEIYDRMAFEVTNQGYADVQEESGLIKWTAYDSSTGETLGNGGYDWKTLKEKEFLVHGQSTTIDSVAVEGFGEGDLGEVCMDNRGEVSESNEQNNCMEVTLAYETVNPFSDIDADTLEGQAVLYLYEKGVVKGYPDGTFQGENEINRIEVLKMLLEASDQSISEALASKAGTLSDLATDQWYSKYVGFALDEGVISGYPDGTFRPLNTINKVEFLKMFNQSFDLELNQSYSYIDVLEEDWFAQYVGAVEKYDLMLEYSTLYLKPDEKLTRYDVSVALYQYFQATAQ